MEVYEGDTIEIPYLLLDSGGNVVPPPASATVTLQLVDYRGNITAFRLGEDPELSEATVTIGDKTGDGVLFEGVPEALGLDPVGYTYYFQIRGPVSDDEVGQLTILDSPKPA